MTNITPDSTPAAIFLLTTERYDTALAYAIDRMQGFEASAYRGALDTGNKTIRDLALEDWNNHWAAMDENAFYVRENAQAEADNRATLTHVIEFTIDDAEAAIRHLIDAPAPAQYRN